MMSRKMLYLILIAITARVAVSFFYPPRSFPDTAGYYQAGKQLLTGNYDGYTGQRTPVYPLLAAALNFNSNLVVCVQAVMGVLTSILLYLIFSKLTKSGTIGFLLGLTYALNPSQMLNEFALGNEAICTFFLTLSIYLFFRLASKEKSATWWDLIILGLVCSLCILTRPQFQTLIVLYALFLIYHLRYRLKDKIWNTIYFLAPVSIILIGWMSFQYQKIGQFLVTPDLGADMMNHTIKFIEYAPDRYKDITEILIRHRDHKIRTKGEAYGSVIGSHPELLEKTGMAYSELNEKLGEIAFATIKEKPLLYLASVMRSFIRFFKPYWAGKLWGIRSAVTDGGRMLMTIAATYAVFHIACMLVFFIYPILALFFSFFKDVFLSKFQFVFIYILVFTTALSQAFIEFGENHRYKVSVEPLIICTAVLVVLRIIMLLRYSKNNS